MLVMSALTVTRTSDWSAWTDATFAIRAGVVGSDEGGGHALPITTQDCTSTSRGPSRRESEARALTLQYATSGPECMPACAWARHEWFTRLQRMT